MKLNNDLYGARIFITGATGFIGGRLVDYLVFNYQAKVRALIRSYGRAVSLARLPIELVPGDLLDFDSLYNSVAGCDIVFHCAVGTTGEEQERRSVTVDGTQNMLEAALAARVKRFVYLSTIAVHGPDPGRLVSEDTPLLYTKDEYSDAKIDAEKLVVQYGIEKGLPIVILRPTIVYGPRSGSWTLGPIKNMRAGKLSLIEDGSGIANHVYVDDVIQAMLLAATRYEVLGETFIVSYGSGVPWKEFLGYYARFLGITLPNLTVESINQQRKQMKQLRNPVYLGLSFAASSHAQSVIRQLPGIGAAVNLATKVIPEGNKKSIIAQAKTMREVKLHPPILPRQWIVDLYLAKGICSIEKAQKLLGYQPQFPLEEGMRLTEAWLRYNKIV